MLSVASCCLNICQYQRLARRTPKCQQMPTSLPFNNLFHQTPPNTNTSNSMCKCLARRRTTPGNRYVGFYQRKSLPRPTLTSTQTFPEQEHAYVDHTASQVVMQALAPVQVAPFEVPIALQDTWSQVRLNFVEGTHNHDLC